MLSQFTAHTESSAAMLQRTLSMVFPSEPVAFVIAMASDKDPYSFCRQILPGPML
jgi:folylpolyglutamate synthase/dihydropteroate synthase